MLVNLNPGREGTIRFGGGVVGGQEGAEEYGGIVIVSERGGECDETEETGEF